MKMFRKTELIRHLNHLLNMDTLKRLTKAKWLSRAQSQPEASCPGKSKRIKAVMGIITKCKCLVNLKTCWKMM